ncbi:hypothetical protein [Duganella violaceipulchra]|uniref:Uncharacterized protein n=1 Tax=Duganella violaceipulchra TaxID=2849652 RepID=A0AA41L3D6_9BURK|nr:hypothetical protein [Duganella violaceicalia]MBV6323833.1 hypothetical protein [Duganella violaceicalia]MCP2007524.1 hypothetical protein [Duganella violaceicalia]
MNNCLTLEEVGWVLYELNALQIKMLFGNGVFSQRGLTGRKKTRRPERIQDGGLFCYGIGAIA